MAAQATLRAMPVSWSAEVISRAAWAEVMVRESMTRMLESCILGSSDSIGYDGY